jgi:hypothetical protein
MKGRIVECIPRGESTAAWQFLPSEDGVLRVNASGVFSSLDLDRLTGAIAVAVSRAGARGVIVDHRDSEVCLPTMEIFAQPQAASRLGLPRHVPMAMAFRRISELERFLETVSNNHGYRLRVFASETEAVSYARGQFHPSPMSVFYDASLVEG